MKRYASLLLVFALLFCLTACGDGSVKDKKNDRTTAKSTTSTTQTPMVEVPDFVGEMYYAEIENNVEYDSRFNLNIVWAEADDFSFEKGEVFKQEPAAGNVVERGKTVTLYVNGVVLDASVWDVDPAEIAGTHKNTVRLWLERSGFAVYESYQRSGSYPAGHVISIDIEAGKVYPYGTRVTMTISTGA